MDRQTVHEIIQKCFFNNDSIGSSGPDSAMYILLDPTVQRTMAILNP